MLQKILFPTDFSDVANKALQYVKKFKECGATEVTVLHIINQANLEFIREFSDSYSTTFGKIPHFANIEQDLNKSAAEEMKPIVEELKALGFMVNERLVEGIPLRVILKVAEEENPSLIVLGSHGKSNMEEVFLGSISEKVMRKAKHPVLMVKR